MDIFHHKIGTQSCLKTMCHFILTTAILFTHCPLCNAISAIGRRGCMHQTLCMICTTDNWGSAAGDKLYANTAVHSSRLSLSSCSMWCFNGIRIVIDIYEQCDWDLILYCFDWILSHFSINFVLMFVIFFNFSVLWVFACWWYCLSMPIMTCNLF